MKNLKYKLSNLLIFGLAISLFVALSIQTYRLERQNRTLKRELEKEKTISEIATDKINSLEFDINHRKGQDLRARLSEQCLYHVIANSESYPKLTQLLKNRKEIPMGFWFVDVTDSKTDNLYLGKFYSMPNEKVHYNTIDQITSHYFLIEHLEAEGAIKILDSIDGFARFAAGFKRQRNGQWHFKASRNNKTGTYTIKQNRFVEVETNQKNNFNDLGSNKFTQRLESTCCFMIA